MLNKETKKKIDNARNILVGVLPLPSDQIELITIALIYKFMDDQDEELRSVGQEEKFFVDELKDYSWQQLMSNQLSAEQRVTKFINAIEEIQKSKHIPSLFKEIFTNTFLKFRDGRVLQLFLDKIDEFSYNHSEELGNAFEYLLMTMGAQGDNGQFRTPRNIIDFLVEVVNPTKHDSIIDPACGTGGFLVSAYKHILRNNTTGLENFRVDLRNYAIDGIPANLGDKLTATERKKLEQNVEGYDNTPLMVRLARVNLYLHHFTNPKIHEYNTLTTVLILVKHFQLVII
ncbi:MAG: N-6 DNA methylase [Chitinophagaceae bacterium]